MDGQPLPESTSPTPSMSAASVVSSSKQPTYTTAGTIYKPSSSQPLQPPTRRGRSLKWPIGSSSHTADLAFLPKTALSELKASAGSSYSTLQQYTPLQQNYDRAISPFNSQDHLQAKMPTPDIPSLQLSNIPNFQSIGMPDPRFRERQMRNGKEVFFGNFSDGEDGDNEDGVNGDDNDNDNDNDVDDDDDDDDVNNNALKNLPVQSLKHLASYSNPTQKAAQKAFQRGSRVRPYVLSSSMGSASSSTSPLGLASLNLSDVPNDGRNGNSSTKHLLMTEPYTLRRAQRDVLSKLDGVLSTRNSTPVPGPSSMRPRAKSASIEASQSSLSRNVPMPLTAGPPGQRQFRPLNFDRALKALNLQSSPLNYNDEDDGPLSNTNYRLNQRGVEDFYEATGSLDTTPTAASMLSTTFKNKSYTAQMQGVQLPSGILDSEEELYTTSDPITSGSGLTGHWNAWGESSTRYTSWGFPTARATCTSYRVRRLRMTDEEYAEHNRKLDEYWYYGLNNRIGPHFEPPKITQPDYREYRKPHKYGAIGDGRPKASVTQPNAFDTEKSEATIPASDYNTPMFEMFKNGCNSDNNDEHVCAKI
ncbi:hypothetical protein E4U55_005078 [Claviceps digitariae]|nr:hypothetical protein E4U55_005078 [Claviceps digitariae]